MSGQLNELGFMGWAGDILATHMEGLSRPLTYVGLVVIYVLIHFVTAVFLVIGTGWILLVNR